jgi:hypothetical protein
MSADARTRLLARADAAVKEDGTEAQLLELRAVVAVQLAADVKALAGSIRRELLQHHVNAYAEVISEASELARRVADAQIRSADRQRLRRHRPLVDTVLETARILAALDQLLAQPYERSAVTLDERWDRGMPRWRAQRLTSPAGRFIVLHVRIRRRVRPAWATTVRPMADSERYVINLTLKIMRYERPEHLSDDEVRDLIAGLRRHHFDPAARRAGSTPLADWLVRAPNDPGLSGE